MSKKLLKIKIQTKPVLKEGPSDVDTLLLEFAKLSKAFIQSSEAAQNARAAFKAFAKGTKLPKRAAFMNLDPGTLKTVGDALDDAVKQVPKVLDRAEDIFKETLRNTDVVKRADDADAVLSGLKAMKKRLAKIANTDGLNLTSKRKAIETIRKIETKIDVIEGLRDSSISYISSASRRAKQAANSIEDLPSKLPNPQKVNDLGEEGAKKAMKEVIEETGEEGAKAAAEEGSSWRKWLIGAGLLATATAMYKVGTKKADADDKKPTPTPTPTPGGGGTTIGSYDLFNQLAVQVTGQKDVKEAVKMIQVMLVNLGYSVKKGETDSGFSPKKMLSVQLGAANFKAAGIDGKVGPGTQGAVIRFQKANGLKPDGLVGPNTYAKLVSITKGGDKKKAPEGKISSGQAKSAGKSIAEIVNELSRRGEQGGFQHIINAYVEISRALVTKLMGGSGFDGDLSMAAGSEAGLRKLVQNVLPPMPAGASPEEKMNHASETLMMLPIRIQNSTINSIDTGIKPKQIVQLAIKILNEKLKIDLSVPDAADKEDPTLEESKKYDLDFSKWSKIF